MTDEPNTNRSTNIMSLLAQVCHLERRRSHALLHEVGLHRGYHAILSQLWHEDGVRQTDLVHHGHVKAATVSKTLYAMEEVDLVRRERDPDDRRVMRVYLTDQGRALRDHTGLVRPRLAEEAMEGLDDEALAALEGALVHIAENLQRAAASWEAEHGHATSHGRRGTHRRSGAHNETGRQPGIVEEARG